MGESRLKLVVTDLVIPGRTLSAFSAPSYKWHGDAITHPPTGYGRSHRLNSAGEFVPWNMWQMNIRIISLPTMPVTPANTTGHDFDDDTMGFRHRVKHLLDVRCD